MSDTIIRVENLGKKYIIGHQQEGRSRYVALRDVLADSAKSFWKTIRNPKATKKNNQEEFWALSDVSFEVKQGEAIGIIGRNGAGKSTLLKILSRITEPTTGRITLGGRVASLLEVGTGFHPELTGRENIYLNGAILGMSRAEIKRKFDEIVAFAEVEKFLDTPVKRFSSGMYVRLAFAVAAHLEPEILVVDEVLAVGDAAFQTKCLGKMGDVAEKEGRTVLFVSHNMSAILSLCNRAILLDKGNCIGDGLPDKIIPQYLSSGAISKGEISDFSQPQPGQKLKIRKLRLVDNWGKNSTDFERQNQVFLELYWEVLIAGYKYNLYFEVESLQYGCIFISGLIDIEPIEMLETFWDVGYYKGKIKLPIEIMRSGEYCIRSVSGIPMVEFLDVMKDELYFNLHDSSSPIVKTSENRKGSILPILKWDVNKLDKNLEKL